MRSGITVATEGCLDVDVVVRLAAGPIDESLSYRCYLHCSSVHWSLV